MLAAGGMCAVLALRTLAAALGWVDVSVLTNRNWMQTATFLFGYLAIILYELLSGGKRPVEPGIRPV
ncbi:MAG TPA: hypothetical protein PLD37_08285, partial [Usitatibacteraceae bacterium]|nr:hypothetical protein [Usitatibacteraceae bacterium]